MPDIELLIVSFLMLLISLLGVLGIKEAIVLLKQRNGLLRTVGAVVLLVVCAILASPMFMWTITAWELGHPILAAIYGPVCVFMSAWVLKNYQPPKGNTQDSTPSSPQ